MRARNILFAVAVLAVVAVFVWRPWRDEPAPAEDVAAADAEPAAAAPPPTSPSPPIEAVVDAGPVAPPPATPPPARTREMTLTRVPDAGVVPVVPTSENRGSLQALHKAMVGAVPAAARL